MNTIYKSASLGGQQVLPCGVNFPTQQKDMGFVVTWKKGSLGLDHVLLTKVDGYSPTIEKDYQERLHIVNKASLQISHIEAKDQDWYECSILFTNGNRETPINNTWIYLTVHSPPHITRSSGTLLNVPKGERTKIFCEGKGSPEPKITWTKDGQVLNNTARTTVDKNEVRISNVQREDGGIYICTFSNIVGDRSQPIKLVVEGGPYIMTHPGNQTVLEGQRVVFPCGTEGYPSTIVHTWYRDLTDIRMTKAYEAKRVILMPDGSLVIKSAIKEDKGWYTCRPSNGLGQDEASAYLNVVYKPTVGKMPSELVWAKGFSQSIDCKVDSNPPLQNVYWVKDQEQITSTGHYEVLSNGTLVVNNVEESDAGSYMCTPENAMGQGLSSSRVQVLVREAPKITVKPEKLYVRRVGGSVSMTCEATGVPTVSIKWVKVGGHLLHSNSRVSVTDKHLEIKNITKADHGKYECQAANAIAIGTDTAVTELRIDSTTPHAPYNMTVTPGLFNATISWEPAYDGGTPQSYVVWFKKSTQTDWFTMPIPGREVTHFTVYKLQPDTEYEFKIVAVNTLGNGSFSDTVSQRTLEYSSDAVSVLPSDQDGVPYYPEIHENLGVQPSPPLNLTAYVRGRDIFLKWRPPSSSPVPIFSYRIEYQHDGKWQVYSPRISGNTSSSVVLPNMPSGTYNVWIRSYGVLAYSVTSNTVRVRVSNDGVLIPQALIGGIIGGILFLLVAILLALVAVFYSRRKERKAKEKHYNGVTYGKPNEMNGRYPKSETKRDRWQRHGGGDLMTSPESTESIFFMSQTQSHNQPIRALRPLMLLQNTHDRNRFHDGGKDSGHTTSSQVPWTNQSSSLGRNHQSGSCRQRLNKANLKIGNMTWPDENSDERSRNQLPERSLPSSYNHLPKIHPTLYDNPYLPNPQKHPTISQSHSSLSKSYSFPSYHDRNTRGVSTVNLQHRNLHSAYIPPSASYPLYFQPAILGCSNANPSSIQSNEHSPAVMTSQPCGSPAVMTSQPCGSSDFQGIFRNSSQLPNHEARLNQFSGLHEVSLPQLSNSYKLQVPQQPGFQDAPLYPSSNQCKGRLHPSNLSEIPCFQGNKYIKPNWSAQKTVNTLDNNVDKSAGCIQLKISKQISPSDDTANKHSTITTPSSHFNSKGSTRFVPYATSVQTHAHPSRDSDNCYDSCYSDNFLHNIPQGRSQRAGTTCQRSQPTSLQKVRNASFSRAVTHSGSLHVGSADPVQGCNNSSSHNRQSYNNLHSSKHSQIPHSYSNIQRQKQLSFSRRHFSRQHHNPMTISKSHSTPLPQKYVSIYQSQSTPQPLEKLPIPRSHSSPSPYNKRNVDSESNNPKQFSTHVTSNNRSDKPHDSSHHRGCHSFSSTELSAGSSPYNNPKQYSTHVTSNNRNDESHHLRGHNFASHELPAGSSPPTSDQFPLFSASFPDLALQPPTRTASEANQGWSKIPHRHKHYPRSKSHEAFIDSHAHNNSQKPKQQHSYPRHKVSFFTGDSTTASCQKRSFKPYPSGIDVIESRITGDASQQRHADVYLPRTVTAAANVDSSHAVRINRCSQAETQVCVQLKGAASERCTHSNSEQDKYMRKCGTIVYYTRQLKSGEKHFQKDDNLQTSCQSRNLGYGKADQVKTHSEICHSHQYWHPDFEKRLQRLREEFREYKQQNQTSYTGQSTSLTASSVTSKGVKKSSIYSMDSEML